jgi:hypothetical protein
MSILLVETYVVKVEKQAGFEPLLNQFLDYKKNHQELFKGVLSWRLYKQKYGAVGGMYIELWEYQNLAEMEEINKRIFEDAVMKRINVDFHNLVEPATFSSCIWTAVS